MPTYEYQCVNCGGKFEVRATMLEREKGLKPVCPTCGKSQVQAVMNAIAIGSSAPKARSSGCCSGTGCCPPRRY